MVILNGHDSDLRGIKLVANHSELRRGDHHRLLAAQGNALDGDLERIARLGALDVDRPGRRVNTLPVQLVEHGIGGGDLVGEAVAGFEQHFTAAADGSDRSVIARHGVDHLVFGYFHDIHPGYIVVFYIFRISRRGSE